MKVEEKGIRKILQRMMCGVVVAICLCLSVQAAEAGFKKEGSNIYYLKEDGTRASGFLKVDGAYYYFIPDTRYMLKGWQLDANGKRIRWFNTSTGKMATGWVKDSKGNTWYFRKENGLMISGWHQDDKGHYRHFATNTGIMAVGWKQDSNGKYRYFDKNNGIMAVGWKKDSNGRYRYFDKKNGIMAMGWKKDSSGRYRYFDKKNGFMTVGWAADSQGRRRYFNPSDGIMYANITAVVDGKTYEFDSLGFAKEAGPINPTPTPLPTPTPMPLPTPTPSDNRIAYQVVNGVVQVKNSGYTYTLDNAFLNIPGLAAGNYSNELLLAALADSTGGNQGEYGMEGICMIILNRTKNVSFPDTVTGVIFQKGQFWAVTTEAFQNRLIGGGWYNKELALKAARGALAVFAEYERGGKRTIPTFQTKDFPYLFVMDEESFENTGLNKNTIQWEKNGTHVFFDRWA